MLIASTEARFFRNPLTSFKTANNLKAGKHHSPILFHTVLDIPANVFLDSDSDWHPCSATTAIPPDFVGRNERKCTESVAAGFDVKYIDCTGNNGEEDQANCGSDNDGRAIVSSSHGLYCDDAIHGKRRCQIFSTFAAEEYNHMRVEINIPTEYQEGDCDTNSGYRWDTSGPGICIHTISEEAYLCKEGQIPSKTGSCDNAQPGGYAPLGARVATACAQGKYSDVEKASSDEVCKDCPLGRYGHDSALAAEDQCTTCPEYTYGDAAGANSVDDCKKCPNGAWSEEGSTSFTACQNTDGAIYGNVYQDTINSNKKFTCAETPAGGGEQISFALVNDGKYDCNDGDDDESAGGGGSGVTFSCDNGNTISFALVNDGDDNCADGSDEIPIECGIVCGDVNGFVAGDEDGIDADCDDTTKAEIGNNVYLYTAECEQAWKVRIDNDKDGWFDQDEIGCGTDPDEASSVPVDADGDGVCDKLDAFPGDPADTVDTDKDGFGDNAEIGCASDPNDAESAPNDLDGDGICDDLDDDTDGDGYSDADESRCGTDPNDAESAPGASCVQIAAQENTVGTGDPCTMSPNNCATGTCQCEDSSTVCLTPKCV